MTEPEKRNVNTLREIGVSGLKRSTGYVNEEFLPTLQGKSGVKIYQEMEYNDAIVASVLFAIEMFLRKVGWNTQPFSKEEADVKNAEFLESCRTDMSHTWAELMSEIMTMLPYGWSYNETVYKRRLGAQPEGKDSLPSSQYSDGRIGWRKMPIRAQETLHRWEFDEQGGIRGMWQQAPPDFEVKYIPIEKALLFRTSSKKNNPEGRSVLRSAYRAWHFKKRIEEIEGIGIERDLAGLPFAEVPAEMMGDNATDDDKATIAAIKDLVRNVRRDEQEGVIWPVAYDANGNQTMKFSLMSAGGSRTFDTDRVISRYDQRIAMTVLADFILLGNEGVGSYAMTTTKTGMFQAALGAWLDNIADVFNRYAIPRLFALNGLPLDRLPRLVHDQVQEASIDEIGVALSNLAGAGAALFPNMELQNAVLKRLGLPLGDPDEETEGPVPTTGPRAAEETQQRVGAVQEEQTIRQEDRSEERQVRTEERAPDPVAPAAKQPGTPAGGTPKAKRPQRETTRKAPYQPGTTNKT